MFFKNLRKLNRLSNYDYSQPGIYFVTICIKNREELFGSIINECMVLNNIGVIVQDVWVNLPRHYHNIILDTWIIMPNHVHGIVIINDLLDVGTGLKPVPTKGYSLSEIIRGFKTFSSRQINQLINDFLFRWQRSFYDRIIRNEEELFNIREYIKNNPGNWIRDRNNKYLF